MVYPLIMLGVLAVAIALDWAALYSRCLGRPRALRDQVETYGFNWLQGEPGASSRETSDPLWE